MSRFMPADSQAAAELDARLANTIFRSAEDFVKFYNSGLISHRHDDVQNVVDELTRVYRNVKEKGGKLTFVSREEVALRELTRKLELAGLALGVKNEVVRLLADEVLENGDALFYLSNEFNGQVCLVNEEHEVAPQSKAKAFGKKDGASVLHDEYSSVQHESNPGEGIYAFRARDFSELDFGFLVDWSNSLHS